MKSKKIPQEYIYIHIYVWFYCWRDGGFRCVCALTGARGQSNCLISNCWGNFLPWAEHKLENSHSLPGQYTHTPSLSHIKTLAKPVTLVCNLLITLNASSSPYLFSAKRKNKHWTQSFLPSIPFVKQGSSTPCKYNFFLLFRSYIWDHVGQRLNEKIESRENSILH